MQTMGNTTRHRRGSGRRSLVAAALAAAAMVTMAGPAQTDEHDEAPAGRALADDPDAVAGYVDELMAQRIGVEVPGASVAVVSGDEILHLGGYGVADVTTGEMVDARDTAFNVGSVSKLVTFTAVMQGVEDGSLDLDADIGTYLDGSDAAFSHDEYAPVTLRHLGTHTAGFESVANPGMVTDPADLPSLEEAAAAEDRPRRIRAPGEFVNYSNFGALLAGHIVEHTQGAGFDAYTEQHIFAPLGMTRATFAQPRPEGHPGRLAASHTGGDGAFERADPIYIGWRPAGSLSASASDMAAFMQANLQGRGSNEAEGDGSGGARVLAPETLESMHEAHHVRHPAVGAARYGFFEHAFDPDLIRHDGATVNDTAELLLAPADDLGVFVALNIRGTASPIELAEEIADALVAVSEPTEPSPVEAAAQAEQRAQAVAGEYRSTMADAPDLARLFGVIASITLEPGDPGELHLSNLEMQERFIETEPYVYQRADGQDTVAIEMIDDTPSRMHLSSQPQTTFVTVPATERLPVLATLLGAALAVYLVSVVGWAVIGIRRRLRRRSHTPTSGTADTAGQHTDAQQAGSSTTHPVHRDHSADRPHRPGRLAKATAVALGLTAWVWVLLMVAAFATYGQAIALRPWPVQIASLLPYVIALLSVATLGGAVTAWRAGAWSTWVRVHHAILGVAGLVVLWPVHVLGML